MREFEIRPGNGVNKLDVVRHKRNDICPTLWTTEEVLKAMYVHAKLFSTTRTLAIAQEITGVRPIKGAYKNLPSRYHGLLMARFVSEMATRPEKVHS